MKCIAIDDEPLALKQMKAYIDKTPFLNLVDVCDNAFDAMDILSKQNLDLIFVDINMPDLTGMEFVKTLKNAPMVIFTTAYAEYAIEGFKVSAVDYLLKPISYTDFLKASQKAKELYELRTNESTVESKIKDNYLFVKSEYKLLRINLDEITYIEGMREYIRIHLWNQKPIMTLLSMKAIEKELPRNRFMRVHRSYIVNLNRVNAVERQRIIFDGNVYIPVSEQYKDDFQNFINSRFI